MENYDKRIEEQRATIAATKQEISIMRAEYVAAVSEFAKKWFGDYSRTLIKENADKIRFMSGDDLTRLKRNVQGLIDNAEGLTKETLAAARWWPHERRDNSGRLMNERQGYLDDKEGPEVAIRHLLARLFPLFEQAGALNARTISDFRTAGNPRTYLGFLDLPEDLVKLNGRYKELFRRLFKEEAGLIHLIDQKDRNEALSKWDSV